MKSDAQRIASAIPETGLLAPRILGKALGLCPNSLRNYVEAGRLPRPVGIGARQIRFVASEVREFILAGKLGRE